MTKKLKSRLRKVLSSPITENILEILTILGQAFPRPFETPYEHIKRLYREARGAPEPKKWQYNRAVKRLEASGKIEILKKNDKLFIRLTQKGKVAHLLATLDRDLKSRGVWDGKWRLMIWDIPESSRKQRNTIRWFVKGLGFRLLQKSVFIIPYELPQAAVEYLQESGLIKFIRFLRVDRLDHARDLKKHFGLTF